MTSESAAPLLVRYDDVQVGETLPVVGFTVTRADVEDYRQSVGSPAPAAERGDAIATLHLLALTLAAITDRMPLPATCVHVGQEWSWTDEVRADAEVLVRFALMSRRTAGGSTLSAFSLHLEAGGREVASGRILLQS